MKKNSSLLQIHSAVFLFGVAGLFGKLLDLPSMVIVFGRVFFSSIFLFLAIKIVFKETLGLDSRRHHAILIVMGFLLAVHWSSFYQSIQVSTVAVGLLTVSTFPVFATIMEPYFFKEKRKPWDILAAAITFSGVLCVAPGFGSGDGQLAGILWGILAGFSYAVLSLLNRKYVKSYSSVVIAFYEQSLAALFLLPFLFLYRPALGMRDVGLLALLGIVFTAVSHTLFINGLKQVKTQAAGIISSLEPVYGIFFAALLLNEIPTLKELVGGVLILGGVFYSSYMAARSKG